MHKVTKWVMGLSRGSAQELCRNRTSDLRQHLTNEERVSLRAITPEMLTRYADQDNSCLVGIRLRYGGFDPRVYVALVPVVMVINRVDVRASLEEGLMRAYALAKSQYAPGHYNPSTCDEEFYQSYRLVSPTPVYSETFGDTLDVPVVYLEVNANLDYNPFPVNYLHDGWAGCRACEG